jgi:hypothetical protein
MSTEGSTTLADVVRNALRKYYIESEKDANVEHARFFADDLFGRAFHGRLVESIAERGGERDYLPEMDPPYRSALQERVRAVIASATRWWWDDDLADIRADAGGRAVADLIDDWSIQYALEAAKRGPQPKAVVPPEIKAAYEAERRWQEGRGRW